jgi:hypothetical protein
MAKQRKVLPARRKNVIGDDSLLIRSAESLGRLIGALQRQLEAARQLTVPDGGAEVEGDGHAPARKRAAKSKSKSAAHKSNSRARAGAKPSAAKTDRVRSQQQRDRRARESGK